MNKYLWSDTETTGLDHKEDYIHQIAGELIIKGVSVDQFNFKFRPFDEVPKGKEELIEEALGVSGLTLDDVMSRKMSQKDAYLEFNRMLCKHINKFDKADKATFCAYNANFDAQFINEWYNRNGNKYFFGLCHGGAYFDPLNLALLYEMKMGKRIFNPDRKLATVCKHFGVELSQAHDAMHDIQATRKVAQILWFKIIGK